jgi:hypothetical protein
VRKVGLVEEVRRTMLGELWGVADRDAEIVVLAKVIHRLERVFHMIPEERVRRAGPVIYNTEPDAETCNLILQERQERFRRDHPYLGSLAPRSMSRIVTDLTRQLATSVRPGLPPVPEQYLLDIVRREAELADELNYRIGPAAFARTVRRSYLSPADGAAAAFLRLSVLVPLSKTDNPIVARTNGFGDWLCVFSTELALREHQRVTRQPWSGMWRTELGANLIHTLVNRWPSVGILVNPPATRTADSTTALRLTPAVLADLATRT